MRSDRTKHSGPILVAVVLVLAVYVTFWNPMRGGLELDTDGRGATTSKIDMAVPLEMQSLQALYRTINLVQKRYIDATRIDSRAMFLAALRAVQGRVAKVLVSEKKNEVIVHLDTEKRRFPLEDVTTPWILLQRIKEVFSFLKAGLNEGEEDLKEVEYAAINGMLQTLDPHSVFLNPNNYREMKDRTQGKFGGLGIVISIRDGVLTIISPIVGTPAYIAGLKAGDQIVKIGEVSTVNMSLNDAVGLLRGEPGTKVVVHILRKVWEEPHAFEIVRAIVKVESLESHMLPSRVGYVRIKDFQGNTPKDLYAQLTKFKQKGIRGLVLDLRGCPGGLLEAAIRVSDEFLTKGVIVTTAGQGPADRDVRQASHNGNEPSYPVVVLVNRGSASASEIVAGALKNHGRALLVGEQTFGKGSVQVLYDFHDGSALKLTTAQYLTPGDISIQSVGVVPHVELLSMRADKERIDLKINSGYRESDLSHHFEEAHGSRRADRPTTSLSYLMTPPKKPDIAKAGEKDAGVDPPLPEDSLKFEPDFTINLARDLVIKMARLKTDKVDPQALLKILEEKADQEERKLSNALNNLGIDWRIGSDTGPTTALAIGQFDQEGPLEASKEARLTIRVTNTGSSSLYRLLATSRSDFRPLSDRELAFGKVAPGETLERELKFKVPKDSVNRTDDVLWSFTTALKRSINAVALRFSVKALERPRFAYSFQMIDKEGGNGDSRLQLGESATLVVDVVNVGKGTALNTYATLKNLSGKKLFMIRGREALKKIEPGERRRGIFTFEVKPGFEEDKARFELGFADVDLRVYSVEKLSIPIREPLKVQTLSKTVTAAKGAAVVYDEPSSMARIIAHILQGTTVDTEAESGEFYRVSLDKERIGWITKSAVIDGETGERHKVELMVNAPPRLIIENLDQVVRSSTVRIRGKVTDEARVRNSYIFVGEDKVFFKPNTDPNNPAELSFEAELPLENGLNYVTVVAEETAELDTHRVIAIRRDRPDGMSYLFPRSISGSPEPLGVIPH